MLAPLGMSVVWCMYRSCSAAPSSVLRLQQPVDGGVHVSHRSDQRCNKKMPSLQTFVRKQKFGKSSVSDQKKKKVQHHAAGALVREVLSTLLLQCSYNLGHKWDADERLGKTGKTNSSNQRSLSYFE